MGGKQTVVEAAAVCLCACLSVCPYMTVHPQIPSVFSSFIIYIFCLDSCQGVAMVIILRYNMCPPSLHYTAGSSPYSGNRCIDQLRCCVTDRCTGIRWSICIIGIWALFISLPCMCSHRHVQLHWLYFHMWTLFHIEAAGPDNDAFEHGLCVGIPKFRIISINCWFWFKCKA